MTLPVDSSNQLSSLRLKTGPILQGYPFVGILPDLITSNPLQFLQKVTRKYSGEVVALEIGPIQAYLVTHPDHVQYVLNENWKNFGKGKLMWDAVRLVIGDSIATNEGESWFQSRRLMQPVFTANQVNGLTEIIVNILADALARLDVASKGKVIDMDKEMMLLGQSVMLGTMFGSSLDRVQGRAVADALDVAVRVVSRRVFLSFLPKQFPLPGERTLRKALKTIDDIILSIIHQRRQSGEDHGDLLSRLLVAYDAETNRGMNDQQLRDECVTAFLGGFDTTSRALTWLWYMLDEHPEVERKLRTEIDSVLGKRRPTSADLPKLRYTKMVIQEILRQHPTTWFMPRVALTDDVIGGYPIKGGSTILLSPYITNHLPEFWEQPEAFDPERFAPETSKQHHPFAQFTFGGGPRYCIGKHLALLQMQLIVAMIMQKYQPNRVPGHPVEIRPGVNLQLRHGLKMVLKPI